MHHRSPSASALTLLASPVRRSIVDILSNLPAVPTADEPRTRRVGLTAAQLADRLELHITTVRFHVDQLVEAGLLVTHDVRSGVGRPRRHYAENPGRLSDVDRPDTYKLVAEVLADTFRAQDANGVRLTADDAAERWVIRQEASLIPAGLPREPAQTPGHFLAKVGVLVDLLQRWGYTPSVRTQDAGQTAEILIDDCPLRDLAIENPAVACGLHRGLLRATMASLGETDTEVSLQPFTDSAPCIARVTAHAAFTTSEGEQ